MPIDLTDKEELVAAILMELPIGKEAQSENKRQALERYMRTWLRSLTPFELEFELKHIDTNRHQDSGLSPPLRFRLDKASQGYDRFMARRGVKVA